MIRFSKGALFREIEFRQHAFEREFKRTAGREIDPGNGWAQIRATDPASAAIAYGGWDALQSLRAAVEAGYVRS